MSPMKALTVWQPWASLIISGAKPYEFRGWPPPRSIIGQRIVIHASARPVDAREARRLFYSHDMSGQHLVMAAEAAETFLITDKALPILARARRHELPLACGLGTAIVGEPRNGWDIAEEFGVAHRHIIAEGQQANWGWPLTDIEEWPEPIPMLGKQGLWNWPIPDDFLG